MSQPLNGVSIERRIATTGEFVTLRQQTHWPSPSETAVEAALGATLCGVVALRYRPIADTSELIGMGRIIGDGALNLYLQDVVVSTQYRGLGVGRALMVGLIKEIEVRFDPDATVGLMAADGRNGFYQRLGFKTRPDKNFGPGMTASVRALSNAINSA